MATITWTYYNPIQMSKRKEISLLFIHTYRTTGPCTFDQAIFLITQEQLEFEIQVGAQLTKHAD